MPIPEHVGHVSCIGHLTTPARRGFSERAPSGPLGDRHRALEEEQEVLPARALGLKVEPEAEARHFPHLAPDLLRSPLVSAERSDLHAYPPHPFACCRLASPVTRMVKFVGRSGSMDCFGRP